MLGKLLTPSVKKMRVNKFNIKISVFRNVCLVNLTAAKWAEPVGRRILFIDVSSK